MEPLYMKIVLAGREGVGKSHLITRYIDNTFAEGKETGETGETDEEGCRYKTLNVKGREVRLILTDSDERERERICSCKVYAMRLFQGTVGVFFCYDVTDPDSFSDIPRWMEEFAKYCCKNPKRVNGLLCCKSDLSDQKVMKEQAKTFASKNGMEFFETSAKDDTGVSKAFQWMIDEIFRLEMPDEEEERVHCSLM